MSEYVRAGAEEEELIKERLDKVFKSLSNLSHGQILNVLSIVFHQVFDGLNEQEFKAVVDVFADGVVESRGNLLVAEEVVV
jgi:hypothetical protein